MTINDFQSFKKIPRLFRKITVTEKIDGSNAHVHITDDMQIMAASRNRYLTLEDDNYGFAHWVDKNKEELLEILGPGRHYGEWWGRGINRNYGIEERRFSLFNIGRWNDSNKPECCYVVPILGEVDSFDSSYIKSVLFGMESCGSKAAPGFRNPEGIVIYHDAADVLFKITLGSDGRKTKNK